MMFYISDGVGGGLLITKWKTFLQSETRFWSNRDGNVASLFKHNLNTTNTCSIQERVERKVLNHVLLTPVNKLKPESMRTQFQPHFLYCVYCLPYSVANPLVFMYLRIKKLGTIIIHYWLITVIH